MLDWTAPDVISFGIFAALVIAAAGFGGQWSADPWYKTLAKPSWTPPDWVFPVTWSVLYFMVAVAGWLVWQAPRAGRTAALALWAVQLLLNAFWSYIFFGRREIGLALFELIGLWLAIAGFVVLAWPVNRAASLLFVPYLIWVSYAGALNAVIWRRNPVRA
jgi:translocator protein